MTTGQTILSVGAIVLLTTIMLNFYRIFHTSWDTIDSTQLGIDATTIATSLIEFAHGLAFDEATDTMYVTNKNNLTAPGDLGPEADEDSLENFNDFDDFLLFKDDPLVIDAGVNGTYAALFDVYYVNPEDVSVKVNNPTFTKRLDVKIWREEPPPPVTVGIDTVSMWTVMGYFTFQ